ncbi:MAG: AraC family transcriptional regulator [Verrucomicrobiota bacterium]
MPKTAQFPAPSLAALSPQTMVELFEQLPEVAFFVKDRSGRYTAVNGSLLRRVGLKERGDLLGKTVAEVFPSDLAARFEAQDAEVLRTGRPVRDQLELHWYADRQQGWCLTTKLPLRDASGKVTGLVGISRDVRPPGETAEIPAAVAEAVAWLQQNYGESLTAISLAQQARMAPGRFARITKRLFGLSPQQMITQTRLQAATALLESTSTSVAEIAVTCGFTDHSAFTRTFKSALGLTPTQHRSHPVKTPGRWT